MSYAATAAVAPARPQDDFYAYANGRWAETFELPDHRAEVTTLSLLAEKVQDDIVGVIRDASAAPRAEQDAAGRRIADLYAGFMNEQPLEEQGAALLAPYLAAIRSARGKEELALLLGRYQRYGVGGPLEATVATDTATGRGYVLSLTQSGLALPSAAHYHAPAHAELRAQYAEHLRRMLALAGLPDAPEAARAALRTETALAAAHTPPDAAGRIPARAHSCGTSGLSGRRSGFPWGAWLDGLGELPPHAAVQVRPGPFLEALDAWWNAEDLADLKCWLVWMYVHEMAPFGRQEVFEENFRFYGRVLTGSQQPRPRWMRATSFVQTVLGDEVGARYLHRHLAPGTLTAAVGLVDAVVRAYRARLEQADWMGPETRARAVAKLDRMHFEIGCPQETTEHGDLLIDPADLAGNVRRGREGLLARRLRRLDGPVDRTEWKVPPQAVTAYYRHGLNQVVIPAALLQAPVFDADGDATRNFALLGSIVCHEMSHAFDSRGSRYDGQGRVCEWWSPQDRTEYARRTDLLVHQYDQYVPEGAGGQHVSGARTLGENIADITGLTVAHTAFAAHCAEQGLTEAELAAETRRFFVLWASMWRSKSTPGRMRERLAVDRHAPARFRCNGALGHVPAFYDAFGVTDGDPLYIRPEARFTLL